MNNISILIEKNISRINNDSIKSSDYILSSFKNLDTALTGFKKGYLYVLAGASSMGKTTFLVNLIHNMHAARTSLKSFIVSMDLASEFFINRLIACSSEIPVENINRGCLNRVHISQVNKNIYLREFNCMITDEGDKTISQLVKECCQLHDSQHLDVVFIDCPEILENNSNESFQIILKRLRDLAREKNICIICTALIPGHLINPDLGSIFPKISDISFSSIADVLLMISRPSYYFNSWEIKDLLEINISKNRLGGRSKLKLKAELYTQKITEYEEPIDQEFN